MLSDAFKAIKDGPSVAPARRLLSTDIVVVGKSAAC